MAKTKPTKFKIGDWVSIISGPHRLLAVVVEDRGLLGYGGRRIYGLREFPMWAPIVESEVAEDYLEATPRPEKLPEPHNTIPIL